MLECFINFFFVVLFEKSGNNFGIWNIEIAGGFDIVDDFTVKHIYSFKYC